MAVEKAEAEIQEEEEETIFKDALMLKIHKLVAVVAKSITLRKIIGTTTS